MAWFNKKKTTLDDTEGPADVLRYDKIQELLGITGWMRAENAARIKRALDAHAIFASNTWGTLLKKRTSTTHTPAMIEAGLGALAVRTTVAHLFGSGINFSADDPNTQVAIYQLWKDNQMEIRLHEAGVTCCVEGDIFFEARAPIGAERVVLTPYPGLEVFPRYASHDDMLDGVMSQCDIVYTVDYSDVDDAVYQQCYFMSEGRCYYEANIWDITGGKPILLESPHAATDTGLTRVPVVQVPNERRLGKAFGYSDFHTSDELHLELNRGISDLSDARKFGAYPIKTISGTALDKNSFNLGPDQLWNLGPDGSAAMLSVGGEFFRAMKDAITMVRDMILDAMEVPPIAMGKANEFRDITGIALQLLYGPLVSKVERKRKYWTAGLMRLNQIALEIMELEGMGGFPSKEHKLIWANIVPRSFASDVDSATKAVAARLWAPTTGMDYIGVENAETELQKVVAENETMLGAYGPAPDTQVPTDTEA